MIINDSIKNVNVDKLKAHPANPRQGDVGAIYESIQANGFYGAVVVQKSTGYVLAGNHRLKAAREAGMDSVPVAYVDVDDERAMRILLADNRTNDLASYDDSALAELLEHLASTDDGLAGTGYDGDALDDLLKDLGQLGGGDADPEAKIDKAAELQEKWGTASGDLWEIPSADGKRTHRLLCGDSAEAGDVARLCDVRPDVMISDPPYGIAVVPKGGGQIGGSVKAKNGQYREVYADDEPFDPSHLWEMADAHVLFGANFFPHHLPHRGQWIVWDKGRPEGTTFSDAELAWTSGTGAAVKSYRTVWHGMTREGESGARYHPTQKPVKLMGHIIADHEGDVVIDPYAGSGTTFVAAENEGRTCYGIEIDPAYVAVCLERLSDMGLVPRRVTEETLTPA